jgi:signal transduction histidine kinase
MKSLDRRPQANTRLRADDSLRLERRLVDALCASLPAPSEASRRLAHARSLTDSDLSIERGENGEALFEACTDVLDERGARETAEAAVADRESLLATFGHDLRNLLNVIAVNVEMSSRPNAGERSRVSLRRTVTRMDGLISNMLDLARLGSGTFHVALSSRNASDVVRDAVEIFRPLAASKSVSLSASLPVGDLPARIDADRIFQLLSNLFSNAIAVTPRGGKIRVSATTAGDGVEIAVRDSGRGMSGLDLERIFDPYCQLEGSERQGLGLGLFISKSIVQAHGGRIWAESELGSGSAFFFTVPGAGAIPLGAAPSAIALSH